MAADGPWRLCLDNAVLGRLMRRDTDRPWTNCDFEPTDAFERVKPAFDEELQLLNAGWMDDWEEAYERIAALGMTLEDENTGEKITEFLLHIDGKDAWFRW
ncbi:MAG: hypothetical protein IT307_02410 [Chloroflexi bacterium]|nr:hypothetical protein [Chloroflexota bacterium]